MQFGTKTVKIRRSVQHCCLSVHNVTFILGSCNGICGHLDCVRFCVLLFGLWSVGGLWCAVGDFCDFRRQWVSPKRRNIHLLHSAEIHKKGPPFIFCRSSANNSQSTHNSTCTVIPCCLYECVSEWQGVRAECIKWKNRYWLLFT